MHSVPSRGISPPFAQLLLAPGLCSLACNVAKQMSKGTRDQISSVSGNITRHAEAVGGGQVSAPRMRTDVPGVLWALTRLSRFRTSQRGVLWGARG
ncbi:unnamed protein product [Rangifer tarandus platyrhynchus]|uniref:Uncharacterized protein n=1 Tax=Rangifer tarandus platyrhynchus TaxID=3082113 RepID=A0AC59YF89_RANTA